jgi:hypothetical protein
MVAHATRYAPVSKRSTPGAHKEGTNTATPAEAIITAPTKKSRQRLF